MKLQKLISRLEQKHHKKLDLSLDRTFSLLNKLGNPQDKLKNIISVVGTNSKYSICQSLKAILNQSGYKCNLYLSPHLQSYTERFVYNDKEISDEILIDLLEEIEKTLSDDQATLFEILTCAYLKYSEEFKENMSDERNLNLARFIHGISAELAMKAWERFTLVNPDSITAMWEKEINEDGLTFGNYIAKIAGNTSEE